jgi:hypothetical protein
MKGSEMRGRGSKWLTYPAVFELRNGVRDKWASGPVLEEVMRGVGQEGNENCEGL